MRVLATGATGQYAGLVVPALLARGHRVRALVHDPAKTEQVLAAGAHESVVGDLRDPDSIATALDGIEGVFLVTPAFAPDATRLGVDVVRAAAAAGVRRFVFSGVYHPSSSLVNHAAMRPIEEAVYRSGMEFTVLQPAMFVQGLAGSWEEASARGTFSMPYSKTSRMTFVDYRDVADVAAAAFSTDELVNGTFELAARGTHTREEIAAVMSRHLGRTVTAQDVPVEVALGDMPESPVRQGLAAMFAEYTSNGFPGGNDLVLRTVLGRAPRSLDEYIAELATR